MNATRAYDQFVEVEAGDFPEAERLRDRELAVAELVLGRQDFHACPLSDELTDRE